MKAIAKTLRNVILKSKKTQGLALPGVGCTMFAATTAADWIVPGAARELAQAAIIAAGLLGTAVIFRGDGKGRDLG